MEQATEKQIKFAKKLGIEGAESFSKQALKELISKKVGDNPQQKTFTPKPQEDKVQVQTAKHDIVISRTEKPHSYEFGKAGARHKVYYNSVEELKSQIDALIEAGLYQNEEKEDYFKE